MPLPPRPERHRSGQGPGSAPTRPGGQARGPVTTRTSTARVTMTDTGCASRAEDPVTSTAMTSAAGTAPGARSTAAQTTAPGITGTGSRTATAGRSIPVSPASDRATAAGETRGATTHARTGATGSAVQCPRPSGPGLAPMTGTAPGATTATGRAWMMTRLTGSGLTCGNTRGKRSPGSGS